MGDRPEFTAFGLELAALELHRDADGQRRMVGYATAFDFPIPGDHGETVYIRQGAWNKTLKERRDHIQVLYDHGHDPLIGDKPLGVPMVMRPDGKGLYTETPLANTSYNREIIEPLLESGALRSMSVAFVAQQQSWSDDRSERYIEQGMLYEYGPTPFPANLGATAALHSARWFGEVETHWDGSAAMASCDGAADFRAIAFERANDSDPDTQAHWALPHHPNPDGAPGNADPQGVASALAALNGARGGAPDLKNVAAARAHLEAHRSESSSQGDREPTSLADDRTNRQDSQLTLAKARVALHADEQRQLNERAKRWAQPKS